MTQKSEPDPFLDFFIPICFLGVVLFGLIAVCATEDRKRCDANPQCVVERQKQAELQREQQQRESHDDGIGLIEAVIILNMLNGK